MRYFNSVYFVKFDINDRNSILVTFCEQGQLELMLNMSLSYYNFVLAQQAFKCVS